MKAIGFGDVLAGALGARVIGARTGSGAPVRAGGMEAGTFEDAFFAAPAPGETDRLLRLARRAFDASKRVRRAARTEGRALTRAERLLGTLTASSVRVFEEVLTLARLNRGRVYPSYDHLAAATGLGRATVARAIAVLDRVGFLVRQRRFRRVDGEGPHYKQTSNVYRAFCPPFILRFLPRWMRPAPIPDDQRQRDTERHRQTEMMLSTLTCSELARATVSGQLGEVLIRLGAAIDRRKCESQDEPVSITQSNKSQIERTRYE